LGTSSQLPLPPEQCAYRQVTPMSWDPKKGRLDPAAFKISKNAKKGLSAFRADIQQKPRGVLQALIDFNKGLQRSDSEEERVRAEFFFESYGDTVVSLVEAGWRVAWLPISAFEERGFEIEAPDDTGHFNVLGTREEFARHSGALKNAATLLSAGECLRE